jgi:hydrogenase/urease accessory protein HupE
MPSMLACLLLCLAPLAAPHPNSHSSTRVIVEGRRIEVQLRCQSQSLSESIQDLDPNRDLQLSAAELDAGRAAIASYLLAHYELFTDGVGSAPLSGKLLDMSTSMASDSAFAEQLLDARFEFTPERDLAHLSIRCTLFLETNAFHRDNATIVWNGEDPASWLFGEGVETWNFEPAAARRPGVLWSYIELGIEHIATGYDHIAFLIALLVAARRLRSIVGVVTAFTVAHSVTLACAALGKVNVPSRLVEMAVALSIAYVAAENLLFRRPATRWIEAFGFGLIHGLGFASAIGESLASEPLKITALVGFNLGVECGQLGIVLALALLLRYLPGDRALDGREHAWFAPKWLRMSASLVVTVLGVFWFTQRAGWFG